MISVAIADDEEKIRLGLANVLRENLPGIEIAAVLESGGALMDFLRTRDVDILITDIEMSGASVFSRDRDLVMRIADNGRGVDPAVLQRLNATLRAGRMDDYEGHIGLFNVHSRIQLLFGCDYGVFFLPAEKGSCVEIRYPLCAEMMADGLSRTSR